MKTIIITGGSGGLGSLIQGYFHCDENVYDLSIERGIDLSKRTSVELYASTIIRDVKQIDLLLHCAGVNKLMPYGKDDFIDNFNYHMAVNVKSFVHLVSILLPYMKGATVCAVISNAANIPMTYSSAYNCSKAALAMAVRQMAHELGRTHNITCFGVSPNKLSGTPMSKSTLDQVCKLRGWSEAVVHRYQLGKLSAREETDPAQVAEFIAWLLRSKERHKYLHGTILPYGGPT